MKRVFSAFFFSLLLPFICLAGNEQEWVSHLRKLSIQNGSEDNRGLGGVLQILSDLDAPKFSGIVTTYDLAAQIAQQYPEKKAEIFNLIFRHFDIWLQRHPQESLTVEELKLLLGYARRIEGDRQPVEGNEESKSLDAAFQVSMKIAFQRTLRKSVSRATGIADILDADLPRSLAGSNFRRALCSLAVDRFVALQPTLKDVQRMIGHVGVNADLAAERGQFLGDLRESSLRTMEASSVRYQRRIAKFVRTESWQQEAEILLLVLLATIEFKSESDMRAAFEDVIHQFSKAEANLSLPHGRVILLHYLYYLKRVEMGDYEPATALDTLDFPGALLKRWHLANGSIPHESEEFAIDPSPKWGSRFKVAPRLEAAMKERLKSITNLEDLFKLNAGILQVSVFPSLDMEEAKWNAMVGFIPQFISLKPNFRQLINYIALVPRANVVAISRIWDAEKDSKDSEVVRLARSLAGLAKLDKITTDTEKTEDPLHREAVLLMGRLLLLHSLKAGEVYSDDLQTLLKLALGADFSKVKKTSEGFVYRDFWSRRGFASLFALAKACGLASTRYPYPPI